MPTTNFPDYIQNILNVLNDVTTMGEVTLSNFEIDQRSSVIGLFSGVLKFEDESELHFKEFVNMDLMSPKMMYVYHYQSANNDLIFRYDNAAHKPQLPQTDHKHLPLSIELVSAPTLLKVLREIQESLEG